MRTLLLAAAAASAAAQLKPIASLPGYTMQQNMYAGYLTVNATAGRALYAWFVESQGNPTTDPVVLWTNGGPGCSGIGGGLFSEQGPFRPDPAGSGGLVPNPWTWTTAANVIFIEQPAGVGFSYSNTTADYTVGDTRAAADVYEFLQQFMTQFPAYKNNDLWIATESYGGHYGPTISKKIVEEMLAGTDPRGPLPYTGMVVGNAWTDAPIDNTGCVEMWWGHGMISNDTRWGILNTCNMSDVGPLLAKATVKLAAVGNTLGEEGAARPGALGFRSNAATAVQGADGLWTMAPPTYKGKSCDQYQNDATYQMGAVDIYNLYGDICTSGGGGPALEHPMVRQLSAPVHNSKKGAKAGRHHAGVKPASEMKVANKAAALAHRTAALLSSLGDSDVEAGCAAEYDPCVDGKTAAYLNDKGVQAAIHVDAALIPTGNWTGCSSVVNYSYTDLLSSMLPVYEYLLTNYPKGRYWVVSGDVDGIVPHTGTRAWLEALTEMAGLKEKPSQGFRPWNTPQGQVGGYTYTLQAANQAEILYTTVRNAGHLVPTVQASRSLQMFLAAMAGQTPDGLPM